MIQSRPLAARVSAFINPVFTKKNPPGSRRVDLLGVDDLDSERHMGCGIPHQVLPDAIDILGNYRVIHDLG